MPAPDGRPEPSADEQQAVALKLRRILKEADGLLEQTESELDRDAGVARRIQRARRSLQDAEWTLEYGDLRNARQDLESAIGSCRRSADRYRQDDRRPYPDDAHLQHGGKTMGQVQAERDYGTGTTVAAAVARVEAEKGRSEAALDEVEARLYEIIAGLWEERFPNAPPPDWSDHFEHEYMTTLLVEIQSASPGLEPAADSLYVALDVPGLTGLYDATRCGDHPKTNSLLGQATKWDQQRRHPSYNNFHAVPQADGTLRIGFQQLPNPLHRRVEERQTHSGRAVFDSDGRCGARQRDSRGSATRTRGSRRVTSRSAGGGDDPDPEPLARKGTHNVGTAVARV